MWVCVFQCDQGYCCLNVFDGPIDSIFEGGSVCLNVIKGLDVLTSLLDLLTVSLKVGVCVSA